MVLEAPALVRERVVGEEGARSPWLVVDVLPDGEAREWWEYRLLTEEEVREGWESYERWGIKVFFFRIATTRPRIRGR